MNMPESTNKDTVNQRIHWFGDPDDDETSAEALQVCNYFHTGNDISLLAATAQEAKQKRRIRADAFRKTLHFI